MKVLYSQKLGNMLSRDYQHFRKKKKEEATLISTVSSCNTCSFPSKINHFHMALTILKRKKKKIHMKERNIKMNYHPCGINCFKDIIIHLRGSHVLLMNEVVQDVKLEEIHRQNISNHLRYVKGKINKLEIKEPDYCAE